MLILLSSLLLPGNESNISAEQNIPHPKIVALSDSITRKMLPYLHHAETNISMEGGSKNAAENTSTENILASSENLLPFIRHVDVNGVILWIFMVLKPWRKKFESLSCDSSSSKPVQKIGNTQPAQLAPANDVPKSLKHTNNPLVKIKIGGQEFSLKSDIANVLSALPKEQKNNIFNKLVVDERGDFLECEMFVSKIPFPIRHLFAREMEKNTDLNFIHFLKYNRAVEGGMFHIEIVCTHTQKVQEIFERYPEVKSLKIYNLRNIQGLLFPCTLEELEFVSLFSLENIAALKACKALKILHLPKIALSDIPSDIWNSLPDKVGKIFAADGNLTRNGVGKLNFSGVAEVAAQLEQMSSIVEDSYDD